MDSRVKSAIELQTFVLLFYFLWRAGGLMLIGMALFKLGVLSAEKSSGVYKTFLALGIFAGIPIVVFGALRNVDLGWPPSTFFVGAQFNYWASIPVSLGWIGLVILAHKKGLFKPLTKRLASLGRMALSGYLLETIICTTIFYGHGFGLYGSVSRIQQALIVIGVWIVLLVAAPWWLKRFRYGPFEWLWRCLTYGALLPLRR
jgi:uncharacterized protein